MRLSNTPHCLETPRFKFFKSEGFAENFDYVAVTCSYDGEIVVADYALDNLSRTAVNKISL